MVSVLLVDDAVYMRNLFSKILEHSGHEVIGEAANGDEAITQYQKLKPDVVLMDIVLEQGSVAGTGLDALTEIIRYDPQANVIICSGLDEQSVINDSMQKGAKAFMTKPIEPEKLLQTIIMCTDLRIIAQMGNMGAERAATVLSKLAKQPIQIELPKLEAGPSHLIAGVSGAPRRTVTAVKMGLRTEPDCEALLIFEPTEALKIADIMTEKTANLTIDKELQVSAIKEMGSNMICAFFAAIADFTELSLVPYTPTLVTDAFEAIIDVSLAKHASISNSALIFRIKFKIKNSSANGFFVLLASTEFQKRLIEAGKKFSSSEENFSLNPMDQIPHNKMNQSLHSIA